MKNNAQSVPSVSSFLLEILSILKWNFSINHKLYLAENQEDLPHRTDTAECTPPVVSNTESLN